MIKQLTRKTASLSGSVEETDGTFTLLFVCLGVLSTLLIAGTVTDTLSGTSDILASVLVVTGVVASTGVNWDVTVVSCHTVWTTTDRCSINHVAHL